MSEATTTLDLSEAELDALARELYDLRAQRGMLDEKINRLLGKLHPDQERPQWGPCTRCGHEWRGLWPHRPPRGCPRCGSTGWRVAPMSPNSRRPGDPPNPKWHKNRRTGLPSDPDNVLGRKTRHARSNVVEKMTFQPAPTGLTPPPKLEEVMPPASARPTLVPPPQVRFAEREAPQPERSLTNFANVEAPAGNIFEEPADGVPIKINEDGSVEELIEAVEGDGTLAFDEEELNGHDTL